MLKLNGSTVMVILREAEMHPDREVCGLVWNNSGIRAQTVCPLPNVHPEPDKYYRTAPKDVRAAFDNMDEEGGSPLAWYHSHPSGKPDPSEEDMRGAFNTGMYYLIAYPWTPPTGQPVMWRLSAWECLDMGILVESEYECG